MMKRLPRFSIFLITLLIACRPTDSAYQCKEGICIDLAVVGPVQALVPAEFVISITTDTNISELPVGLTVFPGITVSDIEKLPENAKLVYQDETVLDWSINAKGGEEYTITGQVVLARPTASYGTFSYSVMAYFSQPEFGRVTDLVTIYLDADGNQVDEKNANTGSGTDFPVPTPPTDLTVFPETPMPTVDWPTATP